MGRNWRHRYPCPQNDETGPSSPPPPRILSWKPSVKTSASPVSRPPSPSLNSGHSNFSKDNLFQRCPQRRRPNQQWHQHNIKQSKFFPQTSQNLSHHTFLQKSQRLKQNLVRSFNQALAQIEQWYPDENSDEDLMDWQLEDELVIPQPNNTVYTYGLPVGQEERPGSGENEVRGFRFGATASTTRRAASDVRVLGTASHPAADEESLNGMPSQSAEPESETGSPISPSLDGSYGIA
jgi:hypothetical protein